MLTGIRWLGISQAAQSAAETTAASADAAFANAASSYLAAPVLALSTLVAGCGEHTAQIDVSFGNSSSLSFPPGTQVEEIHDASRGGASAKHITLSGVFVHDHVAFVRGDELFFTDGDSPVLYRAIPHTQTIVRGKRCPVDRPIELNNGGLDCSSGVPIAGKMAPEGAQPATPGADAGSWISQRFGIEVEALTQDAQVEEYQIKAADSGPEPLKALAKQIEKAPPELLRPLALQKIVLTGGMTHANPDGSTTAADVWTQASANKMYVHDAAEFFYEVFRSYDALKGGLEKNCSPSDASCPARLQNKAWAALETPPVSAEDGTEDSMDDGSGDGTAAPVEDTSRFDDEQAEFCRILFNLDNPEIKQGLYAPILSSPGRLAKMNQMKAWLLDWSGGKLNEQFWSDLEAGKVGRDYWK